MTAIAERLIELGLLIWILFVLAHGFAWFCIALAVGVVLAPVVKSKMAARRVAERQKVERLVRHADEEHRLINEGRMSGIYGHYAPAPPLRGVGIWLADQDG